MTVAFYMDEHTHSSITVGLRLRDVDVLTVQEDALSEISDILLLDRATELQRVVFSQDQDFLIRLHLATAQKTTLRLKALHHKDYSLSF